MLGGEVIECPQSLLTAARGSKPVRTAIVNAVNAVAMEEAAKKGYATATDLADYLVKKGLPFRDAHETVAHAVKAAVSHNCDLSELPLAVLQGFNASIEKDVYECLSLRGSLNARNTLGGTAPAQVLHQIARHRARLA